MFFLPKFQLGCRPHRSNEMKILIKDESRTRALLAVLGVTQRKRFHICLFCNGEIFAFVYRVKTDSHLLRLPCAPERCNQKSHIHAADINLAAWQTERRSSRFEVALSNILATACTQSRNRGIAFRWKVVMRKTFIQSKVLNS